ncbi:putative selection and upkeep of intraepithelial T-cells protein 1 homolog isoform X1 [Pipistrellus kuhlii]|uniref:putative selection and upkeep of intraepithelial T-cells protein 1 homolog isoform X1 n=1 Tax=Pipistrellus kuhlii TaxID=59472 RepID=UPI00174F7A67|nr:putative selection and upkeep of intraepithelial T-cells protein 1 homolog isoform X1 [Pipistrellus kuhlii]
MESCVRNSGVMETTEPSLTRYFVPMLLLQMIAPSSEHFTVTGLQGPILAPFGGIVELSCQLSPPQNAEHMEIRWFRDRYTQPVYLYNNGKDLHVETISRYVERTELRKEAIREGKVTLRIHNVSVDDHGEYHCFFKDGDFDEEAITDVKVTATSLGIQILVHPPNTKGLLVECSTGGWFPQPQMEWRDSRGEIILPTSISHSQDTHKLFNMKMTLLLKQSSHKNVTCCLRNPVTGQEERTSIVLSDQLFPWNSVWILILSIILALLVIFIMVPSVALHRLQKPQEKGSRARSSVCSRVCTKDCLPITGSTDCSRRMRNPIVVGLIIIVLTLSVITSLIVYLHHKSRVPASDPHFQLDTMWLEDITVILCVLTVFITMIISFIYFKFRGILEYRIQASNISSGTLDKSTVEEEACMATLQNSET